MSRSAVPVTVETIARASTVATFDAIVPIELPKMFVGYGPLPAVSGTSDQTGALRAMVNGVRGEFWFSPATGDGTEIRWRYTFEPRGLGWPIVALVIPRLWRRYAHKAIALGVEEAEGR